MNEAATKQDIQNLELVLKQRFDGMFEELGRMIKGGFDQMTGEFGLVHREIDDIKLRLDQAAYRFELVELEHRVGALEDHTGIRKH
ncbi:MAG: hypothetical protein HY420_01250 [Candidatus Kerfeldbacteria bacterium]|nr:hypothetical protein [Candidatus Kerfeldbacteria bacterium]